MGDNEIIKAMELCASKDYTCVECLYGSCMDLTKDAFDLINRQKAEIEQLKKLLESRHRVIESLEGTIISLPDEIRAETVKEVAERLKSKQRRILDYDEAGFAAPTQIVYVETIDNLVKEFPGGE